MPRCSGLRVLALAAAAAVPAAVVADDCPFPSVIQLPTGFAPEGIAIIDNYAIVSSFTRRSPTRPNSIFQLYQADLCTGETKEFVAADRGSTMKVGMDYDKRSGYLFVAGGSKTDVAAANGFAVGDSSGYVYDGDGEEVMVVELAPAEGFVNDVIITEHAAYFTDSFFPQIYKLPLDSNGKVTGDPETIPLSGDFVSIEGFNLNGIEATSSDDQYLIVPNFAMGTLYRVDPDSGDTVLISVTDEHGEEVVLGAPDGLVLFDTDLYVVEASANQVTKIELNYPHFTEGVVVETLSGGGELVVPATAAFYEPSDSLYVVNLKAGVVEDAASAEYEIVRIKLS